MSVRQDIVNEVLVRVSKLSLKLKPEKGLPGVNPTTFPSLWVYESDEISEKPKPGIYIRTLPISIEVFLKGISARDSYDRANLILIDLRKVMETDDRFLDLVIKYSEVHNGMIYYQKQSEVVNVSVTYEFVYKDLFGTST